MKNKVNILGVSITNETKEKILEYLMNRIKSPHDKTFIITPNPEMLVYAKNDLAYQDKLNSANVALPDGIGLIAAGRLLGKPFKQRITGVDFINDLCEMSREKPLSIGFLGGRDGVAELAAHRLKLRYPWITVVFVAEEWSSEGFVDKKSRDIDLLFVAYGVPKQEEWIFDNLKKLPIKAAMGVGGSFDFLSGKIQRAPKFMRAVGLEWLFRLIIQPWRWKRQLALITFLRLVLQQKSSR
jgi:N-acetylglucosaminyldiphosphoundecaprenol N-acetyl-beta-D-mannosaminyltransferase